MILNALKLGANTGRTRAVGWAQKGEQMAATLEAFHENCDMLIIFWNIERPAV